MPAFEEVSQRGGGQRLAIAILVVANFLI
jgi:hypothetical protein